MVNVELMNRKKYWLGLDIDQEKQEINFRHYISIYRILHGLSFNIDFYETRFEHALKHAKTSLRNVLN